MNNTNKSNVSEHDWWWVAVNGASCAAAPFASTQSPSVSPVPELLIGYRTQAEQRAAQNLMLNASVKQVAKYMNDLPDWVKSGEVRCIRPENPEESTLGATQWLMENSDSSPANRVIAGTSESSTPTVQSLLPKEAISPLKKLGSTNWVRIISGDSGHRLEVDDSIFETLEDQPDFLQRLVWANDDVLLQLLAYSRLLADGPKIVMPTVEQCEALAHVDLNLTFREYEQPFPVFVVQVPSGFQRQLIEQFCQPCPRFVLPYHDRSGDFLTVLSSWGANATQGGVFTVFSKNTLDEKMEDVIQRVDGDLGPDYQQATVLDRIALNFSLLLTRYGFRNDGPVDPKSFRKQTRLADSKSKRKRERARRLLDSSFNRVRLLQEVEFANRPACDVSNGEAIGAAKSPHWRRGHFRRARVGVGRTETRLVFVRPSFINAECFAGDRSNTEYRIRTDKADVTSAV